MIDYKFLKLKEKMESINLKNLSWKLIFLILQLITKESKKKINNFRVGYTKSSPFIKIFNSISKNSKILDCTAGFGKDSFILSSFGHNITMIEKNPVIFELLNNGLERAIKNNELKSIINRMNLIHQDSKEYLTKTNEFYDFIYLDPMFPPTKKEIKPKISIQYLRGIVGYDNEKSFEELINLSCKKSKKVVIKRPNNVKSFKGTTYSIQLKDTRYDCIETNN